MENKIITFVVPEEYDKQVAKVFLKKYCNLSTAAIIALKRENMGLTRDNKLLRTVDIVHANDIIKIKLPFDVNNIIPVKGDLDILYEDKYIIVINKPYNMPVHPTKVHQTDTLANFLVYYSQSKGENFTFRAINRLDKDTSGAVVVAKDRLTANSLFKSVKKIYCAVCEGTISDSATIDAPLKVKDGHTIQREVSAEGARAVTHYTPVRSGNNHTLLEINLETGRTHQIRCHFSYINHPLAGDDMYGGSLKYIKRQALHCKSVSFVHPVTKQLITVNAQIPKEFIKILEGT